MDTVDWRDKRLDLIPVVNDTSLIAIIFLLF